MKDHDDETIEWVNRDGLYHGSRRVRAKQELGKWFLSPDEIDLIKALGSSSFSEKVNKADLKSRFGLRIKDEIGPAVLKENKYEMRDQWGERSRPYYPKKYEYLTAYFPPKFEWWLFPLFIIFFHFIITAKIMSALPSKYQQWFVGVKALCLCFIGIGLKNTQEIWIFENVIVNLIFYIWLFSPMCVSLLILCLTEEAPRIRD